jgi:sialidase-1
MTHRTPLLAAAALLLAPWSSFAATPAATPAAEPAGGPWHGWYRDDGIQASGPDVTAWENAVAGGARRNLTRVVGHPQAVRVNTPTGPRTVVRFNGSAALWQAASSWGTLAGERTVAIFARLPATGRGVLFDGSTRAGSTPVRWNAGAWATNASASSSAFTSAATPPGAGGWQTHAFVFGPGGTPLGGFILGANVATQEGLACDVAEVLVSPRKLAATELQAITAYFSAKWGAPTELPAAQQPQPVLLPADPRITRTTVRRRGDDGVHTYRIPGLATTPKGTLIAVFDARNKSSADLPGDIDVAMMRSTDNGATWSPLRRIIDFDAAVPASLGNGVGDPAVLVDRRTGDIFVAALWSQGARAWNGSGPGLTPEETGQLVLVKSSDDGQTWSPPVNLTRQVKDPRWRLCFNGPGAGIQLRDGTLVFPAQFKDATNAPHSCFIASTDRGVTWTISPAAIPGSPPTSESAIAELADGSLLLSMRNESRAGVRAWARWEWRGEVQQGRWSEPWFTLPDPTCMASLIRHPHGELIFSNPNDTRRRVALTIRSSADGGRTWSAGRLLDPGAAMYSSLAVLRDGSIGVLYESGDADSLIFARFPLEWVLEGASVPSVPEARLEPTGKFSWWPARHAAKVAETKAGGAEVIFLGDSITQNWETAGKASWEKHFAPLKPANYGFGGDSTQHVLWRVRHGEFDGASPKAIVLLIGTNNVRHGDFTPEQIVAGIRAILEALADKCPRSKVLLLGILPRGPDATDPWRRKCEAVNALLPGLADGHRVHFLNANSQLVTADGVLTPEIAPDLLHLSAKGYSILAAALEPKLRELVAGQ